MMLAFPSPGEAGRGRLGEAEPGEGMSLTQAKKLRSNMTDAERRLWYRLRAHRFDGHKFKRQFPVGPYVVDFACLGRKVVIEVTAGNMRRVSPILPATFTSGIKAFRS